MVGNRVKAVCPIARKCCGEPTCSSVRKGKVLPSTGQTTLRAVFELEWELREKGEEAQALLRFRSLSALN